MSNDREQLVTNLQADLQNVNAALTAATDPEVRAALEAQGDDIFARIESLQQEVPRESQPEQPLGVPRAIIGAGMRAVAGMADLGIDAINMMAAPRQLEYQYGDDGYKLRDQYGRPLRTNPFINFNFTGLVNERLPETSDLVGSQRLANIIDFGTEALTFSFPMTGVMGSSAVLLSKVPGLAKIAKPFAEFSFLRDAALSTVGGVAAGSLADEEGQRTLSGTAAEFITPIVAQKGIPSVKALINYLSKGRFGRQVQDVSEEVAKEILANALENSGLTVDEAVAQLDTLGESGFLADVDDAFRFVVREGRSQRQVPGVTTRLQDRVRPDPRNPETTGSSGRLNEAIGRELGTMDGDTYIKYLQDTTRQEKNELYSQARALGTQAIPSDVQSILDTDSAAMTQAVRFAQETLKNETGSSVIENNFDYINLVKQGLDDQISKLFGVVNPQGIQRNQLRGLLTLKNRLVAAADEAYPGYKEARDIFAGVAESRTALEQGQALLEKRMDSATLTGIVDNFSESERQAFLIGARDAMLETVANTPITGTPVNRLIRSAENIRKLRLVFPDDAQFNNFMNAVEREAEFARTRNVVTGGSQTAEKQMMSTAMHNDVARIIRAGLDPTGISQMELFANVLGRLSGDNKSQVYREGLKMASSILLNSNLDAKAVRAALQGGNLNRLLEPMALGIWGRENIPQTLIPTIRGMTIVEASQYARNQRDKLEQDAGIPLTIQDERGERTDRALTNRIP